MRWGWLAGLPGWVIGVALQLQQPALRSWWAYGLLLCAGLALALGARVALHARRTVFALLAGCLIGFGLTGARAAHFADHALDPTLQGVDIELIGRVASLPQRTAQGERFDFVVELAARSGTTVVVPGRIQLGWTSGFSPAGEGPQWELASRGPGVRAGDRWRFTVRLRSPHGLSNPHGFDRELLAVGAGHPGHGPCEERATRPGARAPGVHLAPPAGRLSPERE